MGACIEPPANTPEWREWRGCTSKKRYKKFKLAAYKAAILKRDEGHLLEVYKCKFCKGFHLTTKRTSDDDMHISNAQSISARPPVSRVPVPNEQARKDTATDNVNNIDCSPGAVDSKGGEVVQEIRLDKDERKAFVGWLRKQGYLPTTANTYGQRVHNMGSARVQYDIWNKTREQSDLPAKQVEAIAPNAPTMISIPPYHYNPGIRYFIEIKPDGGFDVHTTPPRDSEYEKLKADALKWRQLQIMLSEVK